MPDTTPIADFRGQWRFLSNFALLPVSYEGIEFPTAEHAFQAAKTGSVAGRRGIAKLKTPGEAKAAGRRLVLRLDWDAVRIAVMLEILERKFSTSWNRNWLLTTGDRELIEGNAHGDTFWGQCPVGTGENWLGQLLMSVRDAAKEVHRG